MTRKNAYGSRNDDSARLAARVWTVTATAEMAGLNMLTYLTAYLDACGRNGGRPPTGPNLERFLPGLQFPKASAPGHSRPPPDRPPHHPETASREYGHAARWHADHVTSEYLRLTGHGRTPRPGAGVAAVAA